MGLMRFGLILCIWVIPDYPTVQPDHPTRPIRPPM
uniref:Uncharacterized protein n=1 Tax=Fagus sylvatica TaxID=28930 RepID=A0A2N9FGA7_FAGSY